jgi:hypothetical protein
MTAEWSERLAGKIATFGNELSLMLIGAGGAAVYLVIIVLGFAAYGIKPTLARFSFSRKREKEVLPF